MKTINFFLKSSIKQEELLDLAFGEMRTINTNDLVFCDNIISMEFLRKRGIPVNPPPILNEYGIGFNQISVPLLSISEVLDQNNIDCRNNNIKDFFCLDYRSDEILYIDCNDWGSIKKYYIASEESIYINSSIEQFIMVWAYFIMITKNRYDSSGKQIDILSLFNDFLNTIDSRSISISNKTWWNQILSDDLIWT
ncbi:MAG: hypothetical protein LBU34_07435 [Planctomycetaceae bacterium]|jgi:hypothetical protein|nr:hypothetical protein [Planctomycetaceae bacterium]